MESCKSCVVNFGVDRESIDASAPRRGVPGCDVESAVSPLSCASVPRYLPVSQHVMMSQQLW